MHKDWMFWLVAVMLFVEGAIWARLMGPFPALREINMATVAAWVAAGGAVATAVIAYKAAGVWRAQLLAQHDMEFARRAALQVERFLPTLSVNCLFVEDLLNRSDEAYLATEDFGASLDAYKKIHDDLLKVVEEINSLREEFIAYWPIEESFCFWKVDDLARWCIDAWAAAHVAYHYHSDGSCAEQYSATWADDIHDEGQQIGISFGGGVAYYAAAKAIIPVKECIARRGNIER